MTQTILQTAKLIGRSLGQSTALTPRWEATLRALYGLPLRDSDVALLLESTRRSEASVRALSGRPSRELWCRIGRRSRKSSTAALVAVHEALFGTHQKYMLPNERGLIAVVSKDSAGSQAVANFAEGHAQALGIATNWTSIGSIRVLELQGTKLGIAVFPCNSKAPRGFAIPLVILDEVAHFNVDADSYVEADTTILTAMRAPMAQFPDAKLIGISTPYGVQGEFHETVEASLGDNAAPGMLAVEGPTWLWNPEITEARAREIEPNERRFLQEMAAVATETSQAAFELADIDAAFAPWARDIFKETKRFIAIDASSLKRDSFAFIVGTETQRGDLHVVETGGWDGGPSATLGTLGIVAELARKAKLYRAATVYGDQRDSGPIGEEFKRLGVAFKDYAWTNTTKDAAAQTLSKLLAERRLHLPTHERMRRELIGLQAKLLPSGLYAYSTNGKDYVSCLFTMAHAINDKLIKCALVPKSAGIPDMSGPAARVLADAFGDGGGSDYAAFRSGALKAGGW